MAEVTDEIIPTDVLINEMHDTKEQLEHMLANGIPAQDNMGNPFSHTVEGEAREMMEYQVRQMTSAIHHLSAYENLLKEKNKPNPPINN